MKSPITLDVKVDLQRGELHRLCGDVCDSSRQHDRKMARGISSRADNRGSCDDYAWNRNTLCRGDIAVKPERIQLCVQRCDQQGTRGEHKDRVWPCGVVSKEQS